MKKYELYNKLSLFLLLTAIITLLIFIIIELYSPYSFNFILYVVVISFPSFLAGIVFSVLEIKVTDKKWENIHAKCDLLTIKLQIRKIMYIHDFNELMNS